MRRLIATGFALSLVVFLARARLGETEIQCCSRYGSPIATNINGDAKEIAWSCQGYYVRVRFRDGRSVLEMVSRFDKSKQITRGEAVQLAQKVLSTTNRLFQILPDEPFRSFYLDTNSTGALIYSASPGKPAYAIISTTNELLRVDATFHMPAF